MKRYILYLSTPLFISMFMGCEDFLDKEPVDSIADQSAIVDLKSAQAAVDGLYNTFNGYYAGELLLGTLSNMSDEQNGVNGDDIWTLNSVDPTMSGSVWAANWTTITHANHIINKVPETGGLSVEQKNKFVSEAKFIRALEYLLAIQFFGDYPWVESTDHREVQNLPRTPLSEIYDYIINDLLEAEKGLPLNYSDAGGIRARVIKPTATALLARIFLYRRNWKKAEEKATEVINNPLYELVPDYQNVFADNSQESILEFIHVDGTGSSPARTFLTPSLGGSYLYIPTNKIINVFESGDSRKDAFVKTDVDGLLYISKYQQLGTNQETKIMRLAELYLTRAEALAQQGNITDAAEDLNIIRSRAGLNNTTASDQSSILTAIYQERFIELCFEGHRWIDLTRTEMVDEVMSAFNPSGWDSKDKLLPIPQSEIDFNANLSQNPGY